MCCPRCRAFPVFDAGGARYRCRRCGQRFRPDWGERRILTSLDILAVISLALAICALAAAGIPWMVAGG